MLEQFRKLFVEQTVFTVMLILINGSMLYGVTQKKAVFMLPWLIFEIIGIVISIFLLVLGSGLFGLFVLITGTPAGILTGAIILILASLYVGKL